ncbi:hypothetical protein HAX54_015663, partial [Datura stramonium]|nr:hypothetical protein [Datura stramonium]
EKKRNEHSYSGGGDIVFPGLGMDTDEDAYKVAPNNTPNVFEVGVSGEKTDVMEGGVYIGESSGDVNVNDQECDLKLNSEKSGDDNFFVDMSESEIALITQAVVSAVTINVNVAVNDEAVVDDGIPRQYAAHPKTYVAVEVDDTLERVAGVANEPASGVFMEGVAVNESVVDPPSNDTTYEALVGQVAYESEHDSPECGIPSGSTVVEICDDDKTLAVYRRTGNRHPGKAQQSLFVAGSSLSEFGSISVKRVKGRGSMVVYSDDDGYFEPTYDFEVSSVSKKTWFHTLNYPGRLISCDDNLIAKATDIIEYMYDYRLVLQYPIDDCGIFTECFAKYFIENIQIPVENFDVNTIQSRNGILLWHYGRKKQLYSECNDSENPG